MEKKNNEPMLPMMDFKEESEKKNSPLSFIDDEPQEERIPTASPLRFDQEEDIPSIPQKEEEVVKPKPVMHKVEWPQPEQKKTEQPKVEPVKTEQVKPQTQQSPTIPTPTAKKEQQEPAKPSKPQIHQPASTVQHSSRINEEDNKPVPKAIKLFVVNNAGVSIQNFSVNGKPVDYGQTITFRDERETYELTVSADGYNDRRIQVTRADRKKGEKRVALTSQAQRLTVSFNTPEGIKRGNIDIEQQNPIYEYIKEASHTDTPLNMLVINGVGGGAPDVRGKMSIKPYLIVLVIGMILGWGITALFIGGDSKSDAELAEVVTSPETNSDETVVADNKNDVKEEETLAPEPTENTPEEKTEEEAKPEEKAEEPSAIPERDIKYLKEAQGEIWKKDQLESDACRNMMTAFMTGNIEYLINKNAYNSVPKSKRNGYYNKLLIDLQRIKEQTNYEDAKKVMANSCRNGSVDLRKLQDDMHRMLK